VPRVQRIDNIHGPACTSGPLTFYHSGLREGNFYSRIERLVLQSSRVGAIPNLQAVSVLCSFVFVASILLMLTKNCEILDEKVREIIKN
jgi:hypothetical protein